MAAAPTAVRPTAALAAAPGRRVASPPARAQVSAAPHSSAWCRTVGRVCSCHGPRLRGQTTRLRLRRPRRSSARPQLDRMRCSSCGDGPRRSRSAAAGSGRLRASTACRTQSCVPACSICSTAASAGGATPVLRLDDGAMRGRSCGPLLVDPLEKKAPHAEHPWARPTEAALNFRWTVPQHFRCRLLPAVAGRRLLVHRD